MSFFDSQPAPGSVCYSVLLVKFKKELGVLGVSVAVLVN